ncbi:hypothetical protein V8C86DRAFT_2749703 [Haematococcus lacustris]
MGRPQRSMTMPAELGVQSVFRERLGILAISFNKLINSTSTSSNTAWLLMSVKQRAVKRSAGDLHFSVCCNILCTSCVLTKPSGTVHWTYTSRPSSSKDSSWLWTQSQRRRVSTQNLPTWYGFSDEANRCGCSELHTHNRFSAFSATILGSPLMSVRCTSWATRKVLVIQPALMMHSARSLATGVHTKFQNRGSTRLSRLYASFWLRVIVVRSKQATSS